MLIGGGCVLTGLLKAFFPRIPGRGIKMDT